MADVSIATVAATITARGRRPVVMVSATVGYWFYFNDQDDFEVAKTTNGGASWAPLFEIDSDTTITGAGFDVWWDQWTPGDTGTLIHLWWFDSANDLVKYNTFETANDSLGTERTVFTAATVLGGYGVFISGTKTISGYLYCAYDLDAGSEKGIHRSTDAGVNWSASLATTFVEATGDSCLLFPASNTGDNNDCWAIYYDHSATDLTKKMWDSSAGSETESAAFVNMSASTTDGISQLGYAGAVRHSDGHLIVTTVSETRDSAAADHQVFDTNGTGSITELTAIATDIDDHYHPAICIDNETDDIYVAYNGAADGSETLDTATKVYYKVSTDGGTTWSAETAYMEGTAGVVAQVWCPLSGPLFYVGWRIGTALQGNAVNSVDLSVAGGASVLPILMNQYHRRRA